MPHINLYQLQYNDEESVRRKGQMYCLALLFHIIARTAFEPESVAADKTLITHCRWMKEWVKKCLSYRCFNDPMLYTAINEPEIFPTIQCLRGEATPCDADTYLAEHTRKSCKTDSQRHFHNQPTLERGQIAFDYSQFNELQLQMLGVLIDLHYRVDRLESLLQQLAENKEVDLTTADEAGEWITEQIGKIEGNESLGLPASI